MSVACSEAVLDWQYSLSVDPSGAAGGFEMPMLVSCLRCSAGPAALSPTRRARRYHGGPRQINRGLPRFRHFLPLAGRVAPSRAGLGFLNKREQRTGARRSDAPCQRPSVNRWKELVHRGRRCIVSEEVPVHGDWAARAERVVRAKAKRSPAPWQNRVITNAKWRPTVDHSCLRNCRRAWCSGSARVPGRWRKGIL